jgi:hypothetical protein
LTFPITRAFSLMAQRVKDAYTHGNIYMSADIAKRLGCTPAAVRVARKRGDITPIAQTVGGEWLYDSDQVIAYDTLRKNHDAGMPFRRTEQGRLF